MNKYELALVVSAKLDDEARAAVVERAKGYITRYEGVIGTVENWGKRKLAYEIQKQPEGYYYFIHFEAEPACAPALEKEMRILDGTLRYLIVRSDEEVPAVEAPEEETAPEAVEAEEEAVPEAAEAVEEAVETVEEAAETAEAAAEEVTSEENA
ncbi:MAG: 30S ribosomal protein S6 [Eubacterium sp.]|nr:30S ribosomal protein S6 [Eubacterium sp.]